MKNKDHIPFYVYAIVLPLAIAQHIFFKVLNLIHKIK